MKKPPRKFQFIDNSDVASGNQNATQVRRHVMQEYMREKRWEARSKAETQTFKEEAQVNPQTPLHERFQSDIRIAALETNTPRLKREPVEDPNLAIFGLEQSHKERLPLVRTPPDLQRCSEASWATQDNRGSNDDFITVVPVSQRTFHLDAASFAMLADSYTESLSPSQASSTVSAYSPPRSGSEGRTSPASILSAARTDPFDVLPVRLRPKDQELFDFYAVIMPSCSYGFDRRHHKAHNWYRDVFIPEAMKGPVTFKNTILVHAASTQIWARGESERPLALEYRALASSALREHYTSYPDDVSDETITATMSAAALEDFDPRKERKPAVWLHWPVAMNKIRLAGGPAALQGKPSLRKLINWQTYVLSGYDGRGSSFYFTPDMILDTHDPVVKEDFGRREIVSQCEEFLVFLKCAEHLAVVTARQSATDAARQVQPLRYTVFQPTHPLYNLLASVNQERYTSNGQIKQTISRLGSLMTINIAIWEYRYDLPVSEAFLAELTQNIYYNNLDKYTSIEALMQIILSGSEDPKLHAMERPWLVGRLLMVAKRLSRSSWDRLNLFLLSCLTLEGPLGSIMNGWEEQLREEILSAPLFSYQLPLLHS